MAPSVTFKLVLWCYFFLLAGLLHGSEGTAGFEKRSVSPLFGLQETGATSYHPDYPPPPPYEEKYYDQVLDHFNLATKPSTFKQRYLISDHYWNGTGPMLFYTGNESPVTDYWTASGFITQVLAPSFNALLVFAEHRYFGKSMPFGNFSTLPGNVSYLSPEQALADYADLITSLKQSIPGASQIPVIAFGGSYGGMLTAWFRYKYPHIVMAGLAASAPIGAFIGQLPNQYSFSDVVYNDFEEIDSRCPTIITSAVKQCFVYANSTKGRAILSQQFQLCRPLKSYDDALALLGWIESAFSGMSMLDYPYPTDYGISLPAWPVNSTCQRLLETIPENNTIASLAYAIGVFYNNSGNYSCYDIETDVPDWASTSWSYLACSEIVMPIGVRGLFPKEPFDLNAYVEGCQSVWDVTPRPTWIPTNFGGINISQASNIIFSNGLLDPWHATGSVTKSLSPSLVAINIPAAAHHLDLRGPHKEDPHYVTDAREQEQAILASWLAEYYRRGY